MSGERQSGITVVCGGIFLPMAILVLVFVNAVQGEAYFLTSRSPPYIHTSTISGVVNGVMIAKLGLAWFSFTWFWVANHPRIDRYAGLNVLCSWVVIIFGLGWMIYGFFS